MKSPLGSWPITTPNQKADPPCTGCQKFLINHFTDYVNSNLVPYEKTINCRNAERSEPEYNNLEIKKNLADHAASTIYGISVRFVLLGCSCLTFQSAMIKRSIIHYRTVAICRVPRAHGKCRFTLGKVFAKCNTRQTAAGKELVCRVLHFGHTANTLPSVFQGPRQNKVH